MRAEKPLLRYLSPVLRPVFEANRRWAMARGEESLRLELARRAAPRQERQALPPPPSRTEPRNFVLPAAVFLVIVAGVVARRRRRKVSRSTAD